MIPIFLILLSFIPNTALSTTFHSFKRLQLPSPGCEAYTFDQNNTGPYTGLNDGRIVKYDGPKTGLVEYATTVSNSNITEVLMSGDTSGRLLKYDPKTKQRTVVLTGLAAPAGVAVSRDGSFVVIAEYLACRITRLWLKGRRAGQSEVFAELPGNPDNIKRTRSGDFWVAVNIQKLYPNVTCFPLGQKINPRGKITQTVNFYNEYNSTYITEVHEHDGSLYVASVYTGDVGVYRGLRC
ncbi:Calcium-dependent phosphotriesterase superfamily protein [Striga hermonthica]|uniref:Calcium-dependent phosphotriesterase superfamily protein n=1 Tax=Striga hermonthica TaxID=68872 RepID=A0A9N7NT80_STRHE|nr:Calcium-dependent phosphotriesterase superfamily protein [Striga hermonthica]